VSELRPSSLAPGLMLGRDVRLGERLTLGAHVVIHDGVSVGDDCTIQDGAILGKDPRLGRHSTAPPPPEDQWLVVADGATICCHAVLCQGASVGVGAVVGDHAFLREGASVGAESVIGQGSAIGRGVRVGRRVRLQNNCIVAPGSVIEDDAFFGPLVAVANDPTMGRREATGTAIQGVIAGRACRVGAGAVLLPGIEIGAEAVIAAGAVVTRSVPERAVAIGAPARVRRTVDAAELLVVTPEHAADGLG
jgi:UDP-2-acetamido-3-amino-2,3-dideoxy-glucuronate N-acetyltransferase